MWWVWSLAKLSEEGLDSSVFEVMIMKMALGLERVEEE